MEITTYRRSDQQLYEQTLSLRNLVLRQPFGLSIYDEDLSYETENFFFGALENGELLATVNYYVPEPGIAQLCAFAVRADRQKQGIGQALTAALLDDLRRQNFKRCIVEARESAVGFYEKTGFEKYKTMENVRVGGMDWIMRQDLEAEK
ncbi:hypothetical protein OfM1_09840 [Lactovum odontotermitis]